MSYNEFTFNYDAADYSTKIPGNVMHNQNGIDAYGTAKTFFNNNVEEWIANSIKDQTKDMFVVASKNGDEVHYYQVCYYESSNGKSDINNPNTTYIFAYEIDSNGQIKKDANTDANGNINGSSFKMCGLFSGIPFENSNSYQFKIENNELIYVENESLQSFINSEGKLSDIGASGEYGMAASIAELSGFISGETTDNEETSENITEPASTDEQQQTEASAETGNQETEAITTVPSDSVEDTKENKSSSGMTTAFVITLIVAILAIASSALLYKKAEKEKEKLKKYKEKQESNDSTKSSEFEEEKNKMQETIDELANQRNALNEKNQSLENEISRLNRTIKLNDSKKDNDKNAIDSKNAKLTAEITLKDAEIMKKDSEISGFKDELSSKEAEISRLNSKIKELEAAVSAAAASASHESYSQNKSSEFDMEKAAKDISLSASAAEKFAEDYHQTIKYMESNTTVTGDIAINETTLYKQAPILCMGDKLFMNPDFYLSLSSGNEMHDNIVKLSGIFDIKGLSGNIYDVYGLKRIKPAEIEIRDGKYRLKSVGVIELSTK